MSSGLKSAVAPRSSRRLNSSRLCAPLSPYSSGMLRAEEPKDLLDAGRAPEPSDVLVAVALQTGDAVEAAAAGTNASWEHGSVQAV